MSNLTLKQLEIFVAVAECGSFTFAAEQLYLTQSTVSIHIAALESTLGIDVLDRINRKKISLTSAGQIVYTYAKDILSRCEELEQSVTQKDVEKLRIGTSSVPAQCLLPDIMAGFIRSNGCCSFILSKGETVSVHQLLQSHSVNIGFVGAVINRKEFDYIPLLEDTLVLITPNEDRFRKLKESDTNGNALLSEPLIVREPDSGSRREFERYLISIGKNLSALNIVAEIDLPETILESVSSGVGVSVVSQMTVEQAVHDGKIICFPLGSGLKRNLYLATRKDFHPTQTEQAFIEYVKSQTF